MVSLSNHEGAWLALLLVSTKQATAFVDHPLPVLRSFWQRLIVHRDQRFLLDPAPSLDLPLPRDRIGDAVVGSVKTKVTDRRFFV
jgi:hypothetical protein